MTLGVGAALAVVAVALLWAKWLPYSEKVVGLLGGAAWSGESILSTVAEPGSGPSLTAGWEFTVAYSAAVWKALVAALIFAALIEALLPKAWLPRLLAGRGPTTSSLRGGLAAMPFMMCTCCTAPVAASLRRNHVPLPAVLAYWIGNPLLNPAVLVFLVIVAPWEWTAVRVLGGLVLTVGAAALIGYLFGGREQRDRTAPPPGTAEEPSATGELRRRRPAVRFLAALSRMSIMLVPEYLLVVFAVGAFSGWLVPFDGSTAHWGVWAVLAAAVLGTLVVIPTAGEIPILFGLVAAGAGSGVLGVLLIVLPAISLPSIVMVGRALSWRVTAATAGAVAAVGLAAGGVLTMLGS
ncbi:permease [Saccharomonospora sp. CUA-673]|uniref:permease n=1 Tax=Saccharomonospora sp. CUA-673 TaxID=1904969 RepID=UPI001C9E3147|nr:permease [Saccharomonospora sp. CUA-673]